MVQSWAGDRPVALSIAGSDPSGGAGILADVKVFSVHGCYGAAVLAGLTVQNTQGVRGVHHPPAAFVGAQLEAVLEDVRVGAAKTGMLSNAAIVRAVAGVLRQQPVPALVVDPVMVSESGHQLLEAEAVAVVREQLLPLARVVTPNLHEAQLLTGQRVETVPEMKQAAQALGRETGAAVLVKGGHLAGGQVCDVLWADGQMQEFTGERIATACTHGTGCTLSAALTAWLARGVALQDAVARARKYLRIALDRGWQVGGGVSPPEVLWPVGTGVSAADLDPSTGGG